MLFFGRGGGGGGGERSQITIMTETILLSLWMCVIKNIEKKVLEESMRGTEFVFESVNLLYYKLHKISLNKSGLYIYIFS